LDGFDAPPRPTYTPARPASDPSRRLSVPEQQRLWSRASGAEARRPSRASRAGKLRVRDPARGVQEYDPPPPPPPSQLAPPPPPPPDIPGPPRDDDLELLQALLPSECGLGAYAHCPHAHATRARPATHVAWDYELPMHALGARRSSEARGRRRTSGRTSPPRSNSRGPVLHAARHHVAVRGTLGLLRRRAEYEVQTLFSESYLTEHNLDLAVTVSGGALPITPRRPLSPIQGYFRFHSILQILGVLQVYLLPGVPASRAPRHVSATACCGARGTSGPTGSLPVADHIHRQSLPRECRPRWPP